MFRAPKCNRDSVAILHHSSFSLPVAGLRFHAVQRTASHAACPSLMQRSPHVPRSCLPSSPLKAHSIRQASHQHFCPDNIKHTYPSLRPEICDQELTRSCIHNAASSACTWPVAQPGSCEGVSPRSWLSPLHVHGRGMGTRCRSAAYVTVPTYHVHGRGMGTRCRSAAYVTVPTYHVHDRGMGTRCRSAACSR